MKVFARVKNGKIVEYPIYEQHIKNRPHSIKEYVECLIPVKPEIPAFHYLTEKLNLLNGNVYLEYVLKEQPLRNVLISIHGITIPGIEKPEVVIADINAETINRVIYLVKQIAQNKLDDFAKEKDFDDIKSLISYNDSSVVEWAQQAAVAKDKRDQTWVALYSYFDNVMNGTEPVPKTEAEILSKLPVLVW